MSLTKFLALPALILLALPAVYGQATDGNIVGNVTDASGGAVAKSNVVVENTATGVKTEATTGDSGLYRAENLLVGTYNVTATAPGFAPTQISDVTVRLNVTTTVNVQLNVGAVTSTVQVTEAPTLLDTTTAQVTNSYNSAVVQDLPMTVNPTGGVLNLSLLGAGVTSNGGVGVGTGPSVGGQRPRNNSFDIEGVDNNRKDITGPVASAPPETVAEFTIIQNQFSAEYGHSTGGQFNTVLINGTNEVHGSIWEYLENRNLKAIDQSYARQFVGQTLPPNPRYDQNRLGAMIGGPIKKNKLFYFGSYEYTPLGQNSIPTSATYAPTAAGYSMLSSLPNVNQALLGVLQKYVAPAPVASSTTTMLNVANPASPITIPTGILPIVAPNFSNRYRWLVSVDYDLSEHDQLRARYIDNKTSAEDNTANLPAFFTAQPTTAHLGTFSEFHNFSPNIVNEFRLAYNRYNSSYTVPNFSFPGLDVFPNIGINSDLNLNLGPDPNAPQATIQSTYELVDNLSWIKGKHELKFGFDGRDLIAASTFIQRLRGDYEYTTENTTYNGVPVTLSSLDLFLTDQFPDNIAQRNVGAHPYSGNLTQYYAYVNDNWKVLRNLTVNLGVRYEFNGVAQSMRLFNADAIANTPGVITFQAPQPQYHNFAPRIGFAYTPGNDSTTSIRGGFGIGYDQVFDNVGTNATPPQASATVNANPSLYPNGGFLASGAILPTSVPASLTPAQAKAATSSYLPPLQKQGETFTWNLSYQKVIAKDYTFEATYVGNRSEHLIFQTQLNRVALVTPTANLPLFYSSPSQQTLNSLTYGLCPAGGAADAPSCITVGGNQNNINNPWLPYGYSSTITAYEPLGNSWYHGLALQLTRRFQNHFLFQGAYTWSHDIDDSTAEVNSTSLTPRRPQDFNNITAEKASSALDHRNRIVLTGVYDYAGFGSRAFTRNLTAVRFGINYIYETGELVTPQSTVDSNLNGDSQSDRVAINLNGVPGTSSGVTALKNSSGATVGYLANNPDAYYIQAQPGMYANSGRNTLQTPPIDNIDFNATKLFAFRERMRLEFRADFFNFLNHPQYTAGTLDNTMLTQHIGQTNFLTPGNPLFAQWNQVLSSNPRTIQVGARFTF